MRKLTGMTRGGWGVALVAAALLALSVAVYAEEVAPPAADLGAPVLVAFSESAAVVLAAVAASAPQAVEVSAEVLIEEVSSECIKPEQNWFRPMTFPWDFTAEELHNWQ